MKEGIGVFEEQGHGVAIHYSGVGEKVPEERYATSVGEVDGNRIERSWDSCGGVPARAGASPLAYRVVISKLRVPTLRRRSLVKIRDEDLSTKVRGRP